MKKNKEEKMDIEKEEQLSEEQPVEDNNEEVKDAETTDEKENVEEDKTTALEAEVVKLKETLLRKAAEFENFKRRNENDQMNLVKYGAERFILTVLPVYDDLKRSFEHVDDAKDIGAIKEGLNLVLDKFTKALDSQGVKRIEAVGKEFDVNFHEALLKQPSANAKDNSVLQEVEPGYMFKDKVLKHTKVIVAEAVPEVKPEEKDSSEEKEDKE